MAGINETIGNTFTVYPVPNEGMFTMLCSWTDDRMLTLEVLDSLGRLIHSSTVQSLHGKAVKTIDLRPLPDGLYTLILRSSETSVTRKMLVRK